MAKTKLEINKADFQKVVTDLEKNQTFDNPSSLWKAVEASDWAKKLEPRPLTAAVAYARAKELGIVYSTQPGKRGGNPNLGTIRGTRVKRGDKFKKHKDNFSQLKAEVPERFKNLVDKLEKGSMKAALKLKCLDCTGYQPLEIKLCPCTLCSLYPFRPFQGKDVKEEENEGE